MAAIRDRVLIPPGGTSSSSSRRGSFTRRRTVQVFCLLIPALVVLLWLHKSLHANLTTTLPSSAVDSSEYDFFFPTTTARLFSPLPALLPQLLVGYNNDDIVPRAPRAQHGAFAVIPSRHLSSSSEQNQQQFYLQKSLQQQQQLHQQQVQQQQPNNNNSSSSRSSSSNATRTARQQQQPQHNRTTTTNNDNTNVTRKRIAYAEVPFSKRPNRTALMLMRTIRGITTNKNNNLDTDPNNNNTTNKNPQRRRRRRRRRKPEQQSYEDDGTDASAWIVRENITSFQYIPVGRYATRDVLRRDKKRRNSTHTSATTIVTTATTAAAAAGGGANTTNTTTTNSPYAYAFVMGGVNEQDGRYLGMLYNVMIATYILDKEGSSADVVVYVQMSANSTLAELPPDKSRLLQRVGVTQIRYLPKPKVENFHQIIMQKMVVLDLVEYKRVLFLDTDVMPFCNLDYVFHLSDNHPARAVLKQNLIIALSGSPANAGFFMLSPKPGELAKLQNIIAKQQERAKELPYPHFDETRGWGHAIRDPDMWWTINKTHKRRRWKFVGSHADQGLLYHWVKYVKRSVSIVSGVQVDNYGPSRGGERVRLEETLVNPFDRHTCLPRKYEETFGELPTHDAQGMAPYRDFVHFLGSKKPWKRRLPPPVATNTESRTPYQYWFFMLRLLNKELGMGIDFEKWKVIRKTPLGSLPKKDLMVALMDANQTLLQS